MADERDVTRRDFLVRAGQVTAGAAGVGGVALSVRAMVPNVEPGYAARVQLGSPADFKMGTVTWLRDLELFVLREEGGVGAFSSRCTHLGCTVRRTSQGFVCPCHGARFDPTGQVESGPARKPLPWYEVRLEADGKLWAHLERRVDPGTLTGRSPV